MEVAAHQPQGRQSLEARASAQQKLTRSSQQQAVRQLAQDQHSYWTRPRTTSIQLMPWPSSTTKAAMAHQERPERRIVLGISSVRRGTHVSADFGHIPAGKQV